MSYKHHAFISYAHLDNQPLKDKGRGWIDVLHATLANMVGQVMGSEVNIWRDTSLQGNDDFTEEIQQKLPHTAIMVSVFTPRYVKSAWCKREVTAFCTEAERAGGLFIGTKSRVFRVIKTPPIDGRSTVLPADLPAALGKATGYDFFSFDRAQSTYTELDPAYGETEEQEFLRKTRNLAEHIAKLLHEIDQHTQPAAAAPAAAMAAPTSHKPVVYLTECSRFHRANRERIAAELVREGYTVLPDAPLPTDEIELVSEVRSLLARAQLSVHLIGPLYGAVPDGESGKSLGMWQNELAAERAQQAQRQGERFARVIWLAQGTASEQPEQQRFIDSLHNDKPTQFGAELVTDDIEGFKREIRDALLRLEQPPSPMAAARADTGPAAGDADAASPGLVYLICDERDRAEALPLLKALVARGCDAKLPLFRGEAQQLREANQATLLAADAVVLYHGAGDAVWRRLQESEIKKTAGQRRDRPWRAVVTYLAGPTTEDKQGDIDIGRKGLIDGLAGLNDTTLASLCRALGISESQA
jgi:hypothetical protein